jgi:hypothetical protein
MRRRDKADVVAAAILQIEHHFGQTLVRDLVLSLLFPGLRDLIVLAIDAPEIAVAEKYIARTFRPRQTRFLAEMCCIRRDNRQTARVARGYLVFEPVIAAVFGANGAGGEQRFQLLYPFVQLIRRKEFYI